MSESQGKARVVGLHNAVRPPCPTCQGPNRETVNMVCQTCGADYSKPWPPELTPETQWQESGIGSVLAGTGVTANTWQSAARRLAAENERLRAMLDAQCSTCGWGGPHPSHCPES